MTLASLRSLSKRYRSTATQAVDAASLELLAGEVHALVGENGAGKSTLARLLCGFERPDSGSIAVRGKELRFSCHRDAERAGIGFVPQYSMLAPGLGAADNVALGHEPRILGLAYDRRRAENDFLLLADRYGFSVDPRAPVGSLSASERREVEIMRALARGGDILVLDEPTSILGESEAETLFSLIRRLKAAGVGVIYISHRAREILGIADRVSVMRSGRLERTAGAATLDECALADMILPGGACRLPPEAGRERAPGSPALELRGVRLSGAEKGALDLVVRSGETVAVVALGGNGLEALEAVASGEREPEEGDVLALGRPLRGIPRRELRSALMAYVPTDREGAGLCAKASVGLNAIASDLFAFTFRDFALASAPLAEAGRRLSAGGVRAWENRRAETLSGGNRQRVVAARELGGSPPVVVAANPAQGLDAASRAALFERLAELRDSGSAVLILSSDPEDAARADRGFALYRGSLKPLEPGMDEAAAALTGAARASGEVASNRIGPAREGGGR